MSRKPILEALSVAEGFLSGEELSRRLGVSRSAIWKHIVALRQEGYTIDAHTRLGYKLRSRSAFLLPEEVGPLLETERFGRDYHFYASLPSTNRTAKELARQGAAEGTVVLAEEQTEGRGRLGRGWYSPPGLGIYFTVILRPAIPLGLAPQVTLLASVAVCKALETVAGVQPSIKWPNDVLLHGKKLCGTLTELNAEMEAVNYLVVGTGINVNQGPEDFPGEVAKVATSLYATTGEKVDRARLFAALLRFFEADYKHWLSAGFERLRSEWLERAAGMGTTVRVIAGQQEWIGRAEGIDSDGALLVRDGGGELRRLISGEVSLRPEGGQGYDFGR
ncbi:biotin--[acetyl-CoA-carboxylase] ligase [Heliobacterium gestii]|uniref:Bifunctional ligase/repressor BirA n=1 Tax=Heliomicrobium gestii TaxID=2699 RepID=A0A845L985_HELGE|nr:biotin--[acetyl-CoA-carboxylase] ligase [Heliomicrobium gestii]MBM7866448.1 BirA family biotin operon repressor/biotin-[acetyl-CoA-carboxylase] ligase [Heliomicrobium gestii]MZP42768.1 biotin--[acetyl-CoA-carboxylase] ligase [Heliomicrobium gestii]